MSNTSPDILNYFKGTGHVYWTRSGGTERDLGNCLSFKLSPSIEQDEHKSFLDGSATVDKKSTNSKALNLSMQLDEISIDNLAEWLWGTPAANSATNQEFTIFDQSSNNGQIRFSGTNDQGNQFEITLPDVDLVPSGDFDVIGENYAVLELQGSVNKGAAGFGTIEETAVAT